MNILDVLNSPWAIEPSRLLEIRSIYAQHAQGERIDIAAVEQRLGRPLANEQREYEIRDGVAILPIVGVIAKRMNLFSQISGGASSQLIQQGLQAALADPAVHSVILSIDSPGGTVDGTQLLAASVLAGRSRKPIVTLGGGAMASATYWIGSAARAAYIADGTTAVGSIGIVATHTDISGAEAARGVKTTEISAGKYKRVASQYGPLSEEGRGSIQDQLDYLYALFVRDVAVHRGVSEDLVLEQMADGRVFTGQRAVDAGLVDGIVTLDELIEQLNQERTGARSTLRTPGAIKPTHTEGNETMNVADIEKNHPEAAAALRAAGATAERERIQAVQAQSMPGHEALIETLKFDGKTSGADAAVAVLGAEKALRAAHASATVTDAPTPVPAAAPPMAPAEPSDDDRTALDAKAKKYMADNPGTTYVAAYKAVGGK